MIKILLPAKATSVAKAWLEGHLSPNGDAYSGKKLRLRIDALEGGFDLANAVLLPTVLVGDGVWGRAERRGTGKYMTEVRTSSQPPGGVDRHWRIRLRRSNGVDTGKRLAGKLHEPFGRDLSSRQTQYVVKDLEIAQPINSRECSETAEGVARES